MTDRPILFSGAMVRAILAGGKRATRRTRGLGVFSTQPEDWSVYTEGQCRSFRYLDTPFLIHRSCPYGRAGDTLWVREAFQVLDASYAWDEGYPTKYVDWGDPLEKVPNRKPRVDAFGNWSDNFIVAYAADDGWDDVKWRPSIHMPKILSRIHLTITDSYPQRVQDITDAQALAEGVKYTEFYTGDAPGEPRAAFFRLWDSINAKRGYPAASNPWAWAVEFTRMEE